MLRETYRSLLMEALKHVADGEGNVLVDNPAKTFTERAKKGDFDFTMTDREYQQALDDVNDLSAFWEKQEYQSWYFLLEKALCLKPLNHTARTRLVQTMATYCDEKLDKQQEEYIYDPIYDEIDYEKICSSSQNIDDDDNLFNFVDERQMPTPPSKEEKPSSNRPVPNPYHSLATPQDIYTFLDSRVYGQQAAKRAAASLIWNHAHKHLKRNILFAGPTGSGKSEIWRQASQIYNHISIIDVSHLSADGWSGGMKVRSFFNNLSEEEAENRIYVLDEFDKCITPAYGSSGTNYSLLIQNELLKLIEGNDEIYFPADEKTHQPELQLDTSHMSFVFLGSFETMLTAKNASNHKSVGFGADLNHTSYDYDSIFTPDDLVQHAGMRRELAGRINNIVQLQPMTADDYYAILQNPVISPLKALEEQYEIHLTLDDNSMHQLAQKAFESKMGVRYITARLTEMLDDKLFSDCNSHEITLSCLYE